MTVIAAALGETKLERYTSNRDLHLTGRLLSDRRFKQESALVLRSVLLLAETTYALFGALESGSHYES